MLRYIISLILVNTYYCSFGHVIPQNANRFLVAPALMALANDCKNSFLVEVIRRNIENCSVPVPPDSQTELECLMFYEVSTQLCTDIHQPEIDLKENFAKENKIVEDVETLCENAKRWKISNLEMYPEQKNVLEKAFNNKRACLKLCSVTDVFNVDANFYCKFFQWGLDMIKSQGITTAQHDILSVPTQNSLQNRTVTALLKTVNVTISKNDNDIKNIESQLSETSDNVNTNIEVSGQAPMNNQASKSTSTIHNVIETVEKTSQQVPAPSIKTESEKPAAVAEEPPKQENIDNIESKIPNQKEKIKPVIKDSKVKLTEDIDEDAESEFGNDPDEDQLLDQDADNGNDQIAESDPKLDVEKTKITEKRIESITSLQDTAQRESGIFPNPIQDSFADDDDHFFPFFLTAIILVVLLYILYHNKTKFTKVILGLIVEGRQSDRRRNSRGHSYRRLDTLEQAMSTNTAAPPSKIIY